MSGYGEVKCVRYDAAKYEMCNATKCADLVQQSVCIYDDSQLVGMAIGCLRQRKKRSLNSRKDALRQLVASAPSTHERGNKMQPNANKSAI